MASSTVARIPEDFSEDDFNPKTTQSDSPLGAEASSQDSRGQDAASGLTSTVMVSQAGDPVVAAQSLDPQVPSEFQPEHSLPGTPLEMEENLSDTSEVSGDHIFSAPSQNQDNSPGASVTGVLTSTSQQRKNCETTDAPIGKFVDARSKVAPLDWSPWIMSLKPHDLDINFFLGKIFVNKSEFKRVRALDDFSIPGTQILDQSDDMKRMISRELSERSDFLVKKLPSGSAIHAAASRVRVRSKGSDITDVVDALDITVHTLRPDESFVRMFRDHLKMLNSTARWHLMLGKSLYMVTGIAEATNIDATEATSQQPAILELTDEGIGGDNKKGERIEAAIPSYRETFAYQLCKINHCGHLKAYNAKERAYLWRSRTLSLKYTSA
ncbi:unnamed protein product [Alternaria alternata]